MRILVPIKESAESFLGVQVATVGIKNMVHGAFCVAKALRVGKVVVLQKTEIELVAKFRNVIDAATVRLTQSCCDNPLYLDLCQCSWFYHEDILVDVWVSLGVVKHYLKSPPCHHAKLFLMQVGIKNKRQSLLATRSVGQATCIIVRIVKQEATTKLSEQLFNISGTV